MCRIAISILNFVCYWLDVALGIKLWALDVLEIVTEQNTTIRLAASSPDNVEPWLKPFQLQLKLWHSDNAVSASGRRFVRQFLTDAVQSRLLLLRALREHPDIEQVWRSFSVTRLCCRVLCQSSGKLILKKSP